jgi:hypothetical protein
LRVKVLGAFPVSESIAKEGSLGGEELAWYGNVLVIFGDEAFCGDDGGDETLEGWRRWWTAGACEVNWVLYGVDSRPP